MEDNLYTVTINGTWTVEVEAATLAEGAAEVCTAYTETMGKPVKGMTIWLTHSRSKEYMEG